MNCPSCGAELDVGSRFAHLVVCQYCDSALIKDEKVLRIAGKMAVLAQTPGPLYTGGQGSLQGKRFTVRGRVRYGYEAGYWDEWFLEFDDGSSGWISEDEDNFELETLQELDQPPAGVEALQPGDRIQIQGTTFHVDEKGVATCEGGEGQLPFQILSGEMVPFCNLSSGDEFGTLEMEEEGVRFFRGRHLDIAHLQMDRSAAEAGVTDRLEAEREAGEEGRERVVRSSERTLSIKCFACGAPLEIDPGASAITCRHCSADLDLTLRRVSCSGCGATVPVKGGEEAASVVCSHCGSQLDISGAEPSVLASLDRKPPRSVAFRLGQRCRLRGVESEVVGVLQFEEREEGISYWSTEFLLSGPEGYRWLVEEKGHFSLLHEMKGRPPVDPKTVKPRSSFRFRGRKWKVFERGSSSIRWVSGEMPWVAKVGDGSSFMDAVAPPRMLTAEWTGTEMEWFSAEYLGREEVAEAFGLKVRDLPPARGVAPHQPYVYRPGEKQSRWVAALFALIFLLLAAYSFSREATLVTGFSLRPDQYAEEFLSPEFEINEAGAVCQAGFYAPVDNSWVYLDVAVVNERDEAVLDFSAQMSYYHGVEGGESWSEGSRHDSAVFRLDEPGKYRLLLLGAAGTANNPDPQAGREVVVRIEKGVILSRYFLLGLSVAGLWAVGTVLRKVMFEASRWKEADEADD